MEISVIIPTYNRARLVRRAVDSALKQTHAPLEVLVVDDASTDDTLEILEPFADEITLLPLEENRGVSAARNLGIDQARGEWLAFLDSDDRWHLDKLQQQAMFHRVHPKLKISQCDEIWIRNGVRVNPMAKHAKKGGWIFPECLPRCIVSPSAVIIHRDIFEEIGTFDENLPACEDYDLWLRIAPRYEIGYLAQQLLTRYGGHEDQLSRRYWGMDRFRIQAMEKHLETRLEAAWYEALLEELVFKCGVVAEGALKREKTETAELYRGKQTTYRTQLMQLKGGV